MWQKIRLQLCAQESACATRVAIEYKINQVVFSLTQRHLHHPLIRGVSGVELLNGCARFMWSQAGPPRVRLARHTCQPVSYLYRFLSTVPTGFLKWGLFPAQSEHRKDFIVVFLHILHYAIVSCCWRTYVFWLSLPAVTELRLDYFLCFTLLCYVA
jgi:hypothetical protein